jgi:hypothetical protein
LRDEPAGRDVRRDGHRGRRPSQQDAGRRRGDGYDDCEQEQPGQKRSHAIDYGASSGRTARTQAVLVVAFYFVLFGIVGGLTVRTRDVQ